MYTPINRGCINKKNNNNLTLTANLLSKEIESRLKRNWTQHYPYHWSLCGLLFKIQHVTIFYRWI